MTANAYKEDVDKALESGMNKHIAKPVDIDVVKKTLSLYLRWAAIFRRPIYSILFD